MKTQFSKADMPLTITAVLPEGTDMDRLIGAINASLGKMQLDGISQKRGDVKLGKDNTRCSESETTKYLGRRDIATDFASLCDSLRKLEKMHGQLPLAELPICYQAWVEKFAKSVEAAPAPVNA